MTCQFKHPGGRLHDVSKGLPMFAAVVATRMNAGRHLRCGMAATNADRAEVRRRHRAAHTPGAAA
jgi:hypothetical protein